MNFCHFIRYELLTNTNISQSHQQLSAVRHVHMIKVKVQTGQQNGERERDMEYFGNR